MKIENNSVKQYKTEHGLEKEYKSKYGFVVIKKYLPHADEPGIRVILCRPDFVIKERKLT